MDLKTFTDQELTVVKCVIESFGQGDVIYDLMDDEDAYETYEKIRDGVLEEADDRRKSKPSKKSLGSVVLRLAGNPYMFNRYFKPLACIAPSDWEDDPFIRIGIAPIQRYGMACFCQHEEKPDKPDFRIIEFSQDEFDTLAEFYRKTKTQPGGKSAPLFEFDLLSQWAVSGGFQCARVGRPVPKGEPVEFSEEELRVIKENSLRTLLPAVFKEMPKEEIQKWIDSNPKAIEDYNEECKRLDEKHRLGK